MKASWRCPLAALLALPCVWASEAGSALLFIAQERDAGMLHVAQKVSLAPSGAPHGQTEERGSIQYPSYCRSHYTGCFKS